MLQRKFVSLRWLVLFCISKYEPVATMSVMAKSKVKMLDHAYYDYKISMKIFYENILWKYFVKIFCENILWKYFVKIFCENILWKYFVKIFCENILWKYFVKIFCENILWKYFVKIFCENMQGEQLVPWCNVIFHLVHFQVPEMKEIILIGSYQVNDQLSRFFTMMQQEFKIVVRCATYVTSKYSNKLHVDLSWFFIIV